MHARRVVAVELLLSRCHQVIVLRIGCFASCVQSFFAVVTLRGCTHQHTGLLLSEVRFYSWVEYGTCMATFTYPDSNYPAFNPIFNIIKISNKRDAGLWLPHARIALGQEGGLAITRSQPRSKEATTRSPFFKVFTAGPTLSTIPMNCSPGNSHLNDSNTVARCLSNIVLAFSLS